MDPQKYSAHGSELVFDMDQLVGNKNQAYYPVGGGWGASRYNCAWQMYALTYAKYTSGQDKYNEYAQGQMDYLLGNNPANRSYLIGFGDSYPQHIHHRAANPDKDTAKYILYGTLVGGPTDANGSYDDNTNSYSCTEPALITMAALHWQLPDCMPFTVVRQQLHKVQLHLLLKLTVTLYSVMAAKHRSRALPLQNRRLPRQKKPQRLLKKAQ